MNFELTGKLINISKIENISETFSKREFVIEVQNSSNNTWVDYIKFQLTQTRCDLIDPFSVDDNITVSFNIRGRKWEKEGKVSYFTNLEAWRIERVEKNPDAPEPSSVIDSPFVESEEDPTEDFKAENDNEEDDLPF